MPIKFYTAKVFDNYILQNNFQLGNCTVSPKNKLPLHQNLIFSSAIIDNGQEY